TCPKQLPCGGNILHKFILCRYLLNYLTAAEVRRTVKLKRIPGGRAEGGRRGWKCDFGGGEILDGLKGRVCGTVNLETNIFWKIYYFEVINFISNQNRKEKILW